MNLKDNIIVKSKELGIDIIGFTNCKPLLNLKDYLGERKDKGIEVEFEEKDIQKRIDPKGTFPDCKSIIVIGISYNVDFHEKVDYTLKAKLSKSSWGMDYHMVVEEKLKKLIKEIEKEEKFHYKYFVDTGPLIDRELAKKAGIGYYGKNSSIINDDYGSFIFLGYILTDLDIDTSSQLVDESCGNCSECIKYCPTGALESPYSFNPKRCISYLTQTKERIPYELRPLMEDKIFGCDTCQLVCTKNIGVKKSKNPEFMPVDTKGYVDIEEILNISNREFKEKYSSMSGGWRGKNVLRRNAIIALGNIRDKKHIKLLDPLLEDPSPMIREYTVWALLNIDFKIARKLAESRLEKEKNQELKLEIKNLIKYFLESH